MQPFQTAHPKNPQILVTNQTVGLFPISVIAFCVAYGYKFLDSLLNIRIPLLYYIPIYMHLKLIPWALL